MKTFWLVSFPIQLKKMGKMFMYDVSIKTVSPDKIINYYYQNQCPTGYQNLDKWNIDLIDNQ